MSKTDEVVELYEQYFGKIESTPQQKAILNSLVKKTAAKPEPLFDKTNTLLGWFTSVRLALVRLRRVLTDSIIQGKVLNQPAKHWIKTIFQKPLSLQIFNYAGLSYGLELLIHCIDIGISTFHANDTNKHLSNWQRFKQALNKDGRASDMRNAFVWFACNLTLFLLATFTVGAFVVVPLTIAAFTFDVAHEIYKGFQAYANTKPERDLRKKLKDEIRSLSQQSRLSPADSKRLNNLKIAHSELNARINKVIFERTHNVIATGMILAGMVMFLFPPTTMIAPFMLAGGLLSLFGGSIAWGLGRRLWRKSGEVMDTILPSRKPPLEPIERRSTLDIQAGMHASQRKSYVPENSTPPASPPIPIPTKPVSQGRRHTQSYDPSFLAAVGTGRIDDQQPVYATSYAPTGHKH